MSNKEIKFSMFILLGLAVFFGVHFLVYITALKFFNILSTGFKISLIGVLAFLTISFFTSSLIAHFNDNFFTRFIYYLSACWIGLLAGLFLASLSLWFIYGLCLVAGFSLNLIKLATFFSFLVFVFGIYGIINAAVLKTKNISVEIKNLPAEWQNKKITFVSDVHLGLVHREAFLKNVVNKINDSNPDLIIIGGDLFDGMDGDLFPFVNLLNELKAPEGVFFITGNHEIYLGMDKALSVLQKTQIKNLDGKIIHLDGLQIIGIGYPAKGREKQDISSIKFNSDFIAGAPTILLYHPPVDIEQAKELGVNLQLAGHTHNGQIFPINIISRLVYGKYVYGLHQDSDYSIYTSSGAGTWGPPMRVGNSPEIVSIILK